ncbi:aminopeptidase [Desulfovermiculus halophilus]|uniref:aminopeptidase n=1 Tax=Desulfovermiculus halophilus TaxID=339722 RepID=UPI000480E29D|nr:aminopeptidase [Desulfovermiculus halophilus]
MQTGLEHEPKSGWELFAGTEHKAAIQKYGQDYVQFLSRCKTERETVAWLKEQAESAGFSPDLRGPQVMREVKGKSLLLARQGRRPLSEGFRLIGAHADTPRLDFKQHPLYEACDLALAKTHYYGGIRKYQWLSRPLALHGVVITTDGRRIDLSLGEKPEAPVFVIADLLPHLATKQNERKLSEAFEGEKLNVILGNRPAETEGSDVQEGGKGNNQLKKRILQILNQEYGLVEEDLFSAEVQVVPAGAARWVGLDKSLIGGYGQDDRICVFAAFQALMAEDSPEFTQVVIFWDKEEIGSEGATSAKSLFMEYTLQELIQSWEPGASLAQVFMNSRALSADVHGAIDPDYQDLHDQLNASKLGYGPVFCKFTGHRGKVGANDASAEYVAWLRSLLNSAGIPWQMAEIGKVDAGGGGTVAKHLAVYGLDIIDFGPGVLGMHSPFELSSAVDLYATVLAYREFLK